jgi:hypothetical protein
VKLVAKARSAEAQRVNALGGQTEVNQLPAIGLCQIDSSALKWLAELNRDFRTYLKTTRADTGANGGMQVSGLGIPPRGHRF